MRLLIDRKDLELLLEKDREYIGNNVGIDTMIAAISFLLSVFTANYSDLLGISGIVLKTVFCIIGVVYFIKTVWDIFNMIKSGAMVPAKGEFVVEAISDFNDDDENFWFGIFLLSIAIGSYIWAYYRKRIVPQASKKKYKGLIVK